MVVFGTKSDRFLTHTTVTLPGARFQVFLKNVRRQKQKYKLFYWYGIVLYGMVYKTLAGFHCMVTGKRVRSLLNTYFRI